MQEIEVSLRNTEYPKLLEASENIIFQDSIDKRLDFSIFFDKTFKKFISGLLTTYLIDTENYIFLVVGSRAWSNLLSNYNYDTSKLSKLESVAIIPGNFDVFCICNNSKYVDDIINIFCKIFDKIAGFCEKKKIKVNYLINYTDTDTDTDNKKDIKKVNSIDCIINNKYSDEGCVFPPCKSMHMEIKDKSNKFNEKVLIYFELLLIEKDNIVKYAYNNIVDKNPYNEFNYLNLEGIYLFSELIISKRLEKDYDVDSYRKNILKKLIEHEKINNYIIYSNIIQIYTYMFNDRTNYKLLKLILIKNFVFLSNKNIIDNYNSYITESLRIYINAFIHNASISTNIKYKMFVTGGDAYRRYIPNIITKTNDIDVKIVYSNKNNYEDLLAKTILDMSNLVYILFKDKPIDIPYEQKINDMISLKFIPKYNSGQFRLRYIESENFTLLSIDYRYKLQITINNHVTIINQDFALLDVVLYNDNQYLELKQTLETQKEQLQLKQILFKNTSKNTKKYHHLENQIMDISINLANNNLLFHKYKDIYDQNGIPRVTYDGNIPIASAKYLINDLHNIYDTISVNLKMRFPKNSKDQERFKNLVEYVQKYTIDLSTQKLKRKIDDADIEFNSIRRINTNKSTFNINTNDSILKIINENDELEDFTNLIIGNDLNIQIDRLYYIKHSNKRISDEYSNEFIKKIHANNKLNNDEKVYKIKMSFDDIKYISIKNNDADINDLFFKIKINE